MRDQICVQSPESSLSGEMSLAAMFLVQSLLTSSHSPGLSCRALSDLDSLGLGGRILSVAVRSAASLANITDLRCGHQAADQAGHHDLHPDGHHREDHGGDHGGDHEIKCSQCGDTLGRAADIINLQSEHSVSLSQQLNICRQPGYGLWSASGLAVEAVEVGVQPGLPVGGTEAGQGGGLGEFPAWTSL